MTPQQIEAKVCTVIQKQFAVSPEEVSLTTNLRADLGADSMAVIELAVTLEEEFDSTMSDMGEKKLTTVSDIVDFIIENLNKAEAKSK